MLPPPEWRRPHRARRITIGILMLAALLSGCASTNRESAQADPRPHAECLVCKHNADLACVDLRVDAATPQTVYRGQTYYFCSDECKKAFDADPSKYLPR